MELLPFSFAAIAGLAALYPDVFHRRRLALFERRLQRGYRGVTVQEAGVTVHLSWLHTDQRVIASETGQNCWLALERPAAVITDCWTPPPFRGRGIYSAVLWRLAEEAARAGGDTFVYCEPWNEASIRGVRKAGFAEAARFRRTVWLGRFESAARVEVLPAERWATATAG